MKRYLGYFALLAVSGSLSYAQDDVPLTTASPEDIIRKAITAHGGKAAIEQYLNCRARMNGFIFDGVKHAPTTQVFLYRNEPPSYKMDAVIRLPEFRKFYQTHVFDGRNLFDSQNGMTRTANGVDVQFAHVVAYLMKVRHLLPLLDKNTFTLCAIPSTKNRVEDALGVRVSCAEYSDVHLYFDKQSSLLVKSEYRGEEISYEEYYAKYKKQKGGLMYPSRITSVKNGSKWFEQELVDMEPLPEVKDSEFSRP